MNLETIGKKSGRNLEFIVCREMRMGGKNLTL